VNRQGVWRPIGAARWYFGIVSDVSFRDVSAPSRINRHRPSLVDLIFETIARRGSAVALIVDEAVHSCEQIGPSAA
jgi:hypothetical protein